MSNATPDEKTNQKNFLKLPGLAAFWDFQDETFISADKNRIPLKHKGGPPVFENEGVFGNRSLRFGAEGVAAKSYLVATKSEAPALNLGGPGSQMSVLAWLKRHDSPYKGCEFIAGVWNEHGRRQYGMFLNLGIWDSRQQLGAHVSTHGGPTPGYPYCMDVAMGKTVLPFDEWLFLAITYDTKDARSYVNGELDLREPQGEPGRNPFHYPGGLHTSDADFSVGAVDRPTEVVSDGKGGFVEKGALIANPFVGLLGGLAVFNRALTGEEIRRIQKETMAPRVK